MDDEIVYVVCDWRIQTPFFGTNKGVAAWELARLHQIRTRLHRLLLNTLQRTGDADLRF